MSPQKFAGVSGGMAAVRDVERNGEFLNLGGVVVVAVLEAAERRRWLRKTSCLCTEED